MIRVELVILDYLRENVDEKVTINPWDRLEQFSLALRKAYQFYEIKLLGDNYLLMKVLQETPNIDQLKKQIERVTDASCKKAILLFKEISRYRRRSLIEKRIPFIIENGQMYLPFIGLDVKKGHEYTKQEIKQFTSPAQVAFLYFLYHQDEVINVTEFSKKIGVNEMTASRALNELYQANLVTFVIGGKTGKSKQYKRIADPIYFKIGKQYLKTPVKKVIYVASTFLDAPYAGLDLLARKSQLNAPSHQVRAIDRKRLEEYHLNILTNKDEIKDNYLTELQLWDYDPTLFCKNLYVDLVSLYVSLKEETDERVMQALEETMRGEPWYTD